MTATTTDPTVLKEAARRRTFAIISHPDAGKTTLTEKLLLYGGCVETAGAVRGRKTQRAATSDWMELEKQRGISVSSTVLSFEYEGRRINLLDTPGHQDFSEDTYRTLMAADCAVMVIDLAKGVETQTKKLFKVCALRGLPILTFVNKSDRPGKPTLEVLNDIESELGIEPVPFNWPLGVGFEFRGVVDVSSDMAHLFTSTGGEFRVAYRSAPLAELTDQDASEDTRLHTAEELELLRLAGGTFDSELFLAGKQTPVFFGSALNNFGVEHFLRGFLDLCPQPGSRLSDRGMIEVATPHFAGFVFKIQANLDPRHRDRVAFVRVCAGRFVRDMEVTHARTGKKIRVPRAHRLFAQERETMDEAFPGDIVGLVNPGEFRLGDTICQGTPLNFEPLPEFAPEFFATLRCMDTSRRKQFDKGMEQLIEEGAIQAFQRPGAAKTDMILAAVGSLQFDVIRFRLETEYGAKTHLDMLPFGFVRWIRSELTEDQPLKLPYSARRVHDRHGRPAILFTSQWDVQQCARENPKVVFSEVGATGFAGAGSFDQLVSA
ncbi:MAG: peptide chain release factor 3 [Pirellulaceae bacterium]